ncbi:MAG: ABC transporter substrate-binding protein [Phycisphaerae bacterium]|jgi:ABC-type branched-subunit amino acid transport system substrate-binding protein
MSKKIWIIIVIVLVGIVLGFLILNGSTKTASSVVFGATFPLTGDVASYGIKAKNGIELATEYINEQGGILGKQLEIDFQDDRNDTKEAVAIFNKFATINKYPVVFGSAGSSVSLAICPIANQQKVVQVSPLSSSSLLSEQGGDFFFRTVPADDQQVEILADFVVGTGVRKIAIIYTNNSWGQPFADGFESKFTKVGGQILLKEGVQESTSDFRTIITKLKTVNGLEAIVSPTYPKEGGRFVRQAGEMGLNVKLFGADNWNAPEFRAIAGDAAEGVMYSTPIQQESALFSEFSQKYQTKFGEEPDVLAAYSYDALIAVCKAIQKANNLNPDDIRKNLIGISFDGMSGKIKFKGNGDLDSKSYQITTIKNGQLVPVK